MLLHAHTFGDAREGEFPPWRAVLVMGDLGAVPAHAKAACCGRSITPGNTVLRFITAILKKPHLISEMSSCTVSSRPLGSAEPFLQD